MAEYIPVHTTTQGALPEPCPTCLWWQSGDSACGEEGTEPEPGAGEGDSSTARRLDWIESVQDTWGPPGIIMQRQGSTVAAVQFAPVSTLSRTAALPPRCPPENAVLMFCLRARLGRPVHEPVRLLQRSMFEVRRRGVSRVFAYARPLGKDSRCGFRNLFGLEFLGRHGFIVVDSQGEFHLMMAELSGLVPALEEVKALLPRLRPATPSPAACWKGRG